MLYRRTLLTASAASIVTAPAIIECANAQSAFDWKQAKGSKLEVNFGKHPSADVLQAKAEGIRGTHRHQGRLRTDP